MNLMRSLTAALSCTLLLISGALAQIQPDQATRLVEEDQAKVASGYAGNSWRYQEILWQEALSCWGDANTVLGARRVCLVCSIEKTAGQPYLGNDIRAERWVLPETSVGISASYSYFTYRPGGWSFERYTPFAINLYSLTREPYHRANIRNLIPQAPEECYDLQDVNGYE